MKKILATLLGVFFINQLVAQNFTGSISGGNDDIHILNWDNTTGADAVLRLAMKYGSSYKHWNISNEYGSESKLRFSFSSSSNGRDDGNRLMTLTQGGNLGIGTQSPLQKLDVRGSAYISNNLGIGTSSTSYRLHVNGTSYFSGDFTLNGRFTSDLKLKSGSYIDDDTSVGGNNDDWIRFNGYIEMKSNTDSYGIVLRDKDNSSGDYFGITQVNGSSYLTDSNTSGNYFIRGNARSTYLGGKLISPRYGISGTYNSNQVQGIWSIGESYAVNTSSNDFGSQYGMVYAHTNAGTSGTRKPIANWGHQILFTDNGNRKAAISMSSGHAYFAGDVGIGTVSPSYNLDINGTMHSKNYLLDGDSPRLMIASAGGSNVNRIEFWEGAVNADPTLALFALEYDNTANNLNFMGKSYEGDPTTNAVSNDTLMTIQRNQGNVGIGTSSPDHKLSVVGHLNVANGNDEKVDYIRIYHDGEANLSTEEGALHFRKGTDKYLVAEQVADTAVTRIHSYGQPLVLRGRALPDVPDPADPLGDLTIKDDGTVVIHSGFELEGNFNLTNTELGNEDEYVLSLGAGDEIRRRSVESLTPWVIRQVYHDADTVDVLSCSPHAEGEVCGCPEGAHVTIDASDVIDIEGNLALGDQGFIDNDQVAGPNLDETTGEKTVNDDYIRIQESIEFSSSSSTRGLVLLDNTVGSGKFLNFFHDDGISYFSNSTNSTPDADYFMKAGTGVPAEKNQITFADRVTFNNGFVTSSYTSLDAMNFALDTDNTGEDAIFKVGRGTQDVNDETNWFGLFYVDKDGVATFSSDIGDTSNPNRITLNGSTGSGTFSSDLTVEGVSNLSGNLNVGGSSVFSLSTDFLQDANITGNLNVLGSSNILTGSYGSAVDWKTAYDSRVNANQGLVWNPISKNLDVKLGDGLHLNGSGEIESDFVQDGPNEISYHGSLAIGTTKHSTFALSVAGEVGAEEVTIQNEGEWPDYVFEAGYQLESLEKTAAFIAENKHLPEVPSAQEVSENGIKVGQMNAILLKKIEELTLHLIAKDKEIASLKKENKRIDNIEERLLQLENK